MKKIVFFVRKLVRTAILVRPLLFVCSLLFITEISLGQRLTEPISVSFNNINYYDAIRQLQVLGKVEFAFDMHSLKLESRKISALQVSNAPMETVLKKLFAGTDINYVEKDKNTILLFKQQPGRITGHITDSKGEKLSGATIRIVELKRDYSTDNEGAFTITLQPGTYTIEVSYISHATQQKKVVVEEDRTVTVNFNLKETETERALNEVVVVGYGTLKRRDLTGSMTSISGRDIANIPVTNVVQALQGKVPGMDIQNEGGSPGAGASIRIRGNRSITASNDPLVVLDGIPTLTNINDINFADIESVEVLKDASASAIYGSRGANGVILLVTKKGRQGKVSVNYEGYYGINNPFGKVTMFNGEEYAKFKQVTGKALSQWEKDALAAGISTDYNSLLYKTGHQQNHSLSFSGGNDKTTFYISGNYFNQDGTTYKADYKRYNLRINLNQKITDKLSIGTTTLLSRSVRNAGVYPLKDASEINPLSTPFNEDGTVKVNPDDESLHLNPLLEVYGPSADNTRVTTAISNIFGEYQIIEGLKYRLNIGLNNAESRRGYFNSAMKTNGASTGGWEDGSMFDYTIEHILSYQVVRKSHRLDLTGLYSIGENTQESQQVAVRGIPYDNQEYFNLGSAEEVTGKSSGFLKKGLTSYMGRAQYGYKGRYLVTLTIRADGASIFAPGHKWGYFPSVALAWRASEENFFKNQSLFNDLKLRASYGVVGNPGISPYRTQGTLQRTTYSWENSPAFGYGPGEIPNPELKWESTASMNLGIDFSLLKSRVSGSIDLYRQNTSDLLLERALPSSTGFSSTLQNVGKTRNTGAEISINASLLPANSRLQWNVSLNGFTNKEEIVALNSGVKEDVGNLWFVGHPISVLYDYEKIGIWQTSEKDAATAYGAAPGQIKIKDQDGNGAIDDKDRVILGTNRPKWGGGLTSRFAYAGIDLSFTIYTRNGQMVNDGNYELSNQMEAKNNNLDLPYWTEENPTNVNPHPRDGTGMQYISTLRYFDGSYTTLQNVDLGYSLPESITQRLRINSFRVYLSGRNLLRLSKNKIPAVTFIPENNSGTDVPLNRTFNIGFNLGF